MFAARPHHDTSRSGVEAERLIWCEDVLDRSAPPPRVALYQRKGTVALLDDDPSFVEVLASTLPPGWGVKPFLSVNSCLDYLQQQPPKWEADFWAQQEVVAEWRSGAPLLPLILRYWASAGDARRLTKVLVLDHLMPGRDGLDMLRDLVDWPGHRVLLTGAFDEQLGVDAFNAGLIDHFLVKQHRELYSTLTSMVTGLLSRPNQRHHQIWSATLKPPQMLALQRRDVARDLSAFLSASFVEWVVIGEPFGILGLDAKGAVHWVQLELRRDLRELADVAQEAGMCAADAHLIRGGRKLTNVEMRRSLGLGGADLQNALQVGDDDSLLAAVTRIDLSGARDALRDKPVPASADNEARF